MARRSHTADTAGRDSLARADRFATINEFVDGTLADLTRATGSASAGLVWLVLWRMADARTEHVRGASVSGIARRTGLDRRTVADALAVLVTREVIAIVSDTADNVVPVYHVPRNPSAPGTGTARERGEGSGLGQRPQCPTGLR